MRKRAVRIQGIYVSLVLFVALALSVAWSVHAAAPKILVVYPETKAAYEKIFLTIIDGIESRSEYDVSSLKLSPEQAAAQLRGALGRQDVSGLVALGPQSVKVIKKVKLADMPTVVGAILSTPKQPQHPTHLLVPSPLAMFTKTKALLPNTERIITVYGKGRDDWIVEQAAQASTQLGLGFLSIPSRDAAEMAKNYVKALEQAGDTDVVWVSIGGKSIAWPVMQELLTTAWDKDIKIISSHASDVKKGVLFSFMPDNQAIGIELARSLEVTMLKGQLDNAASLTAAGALDVAANLRMADHLGLKFSRQVQREFKYVYPPPTR